MILIKTQHLAFMLFLPLIVGCHSDETSQPSAEVPQPVTKPEQDPEELPEPELEITATVAGAEELNTLLEENRGKVVLVDFWAMWCTPCVQQFPHTVKLHQELEDQGLTVITVSLDDPQNIDSVQEFLKKHQATGINLISKEGSSIQSYEDFVILTGALPHYRIYDRQGKLALEIASGDPESPYSEEEIDQTVQSLLKATP